MTPLEETLADYRTQRPHDRPARDGAPARRARARAACSRRGELRDAPERPLRAHRRPRDRAPAPRHGEGLLLPHARGRDRHRERLPHAARSSSASACALHASPLLEVAGPLQNVDGVIHVRVRELRPLRDAADAAAHRTTIAERRAPNMTMLTIAPLAGRRNKPDGLCRGSPCVTHDPVPTSRGAAAVALRARRELRVARRRPRQSDRRGRRRRRRHGRRAAPVLDAADRTRRACVPPARPHGPSRRDPTAGPATPSSPQPR